MRILVWPDDRGAIEAMIAPPGGPFPPDTLAAAERICADVRSRGFAAVAEATEKYDGVRLARPEDMRVGGERLARALSEADEKWLASLDRAIDNIDFYHRAQVDARRTCKVEGDGFVLSERLDAIPSVGVYVPGGAAPLVSSLLMNVIPAQVAGVERIVVVSPPSADGWPDRHILAAAARLGVEEVYRIGGPAAVAALVWGGVITPPVDKVVGPGSALVAAAKYIVSQAVGTDTIAGPSEVVVLADETAPVDYVALDLLAQAEHAGDEVAVLITSSVRLAEEVSRRVDELASAQPRAQVIQSSLSGPRSGIVLVPDRSVMLELANRIAPEHCVVMTEDADAVAERIAHAGCIFVGAHSPVSLGDFYCGTNHVLPTGGAARFASPLGVDDFLKRTSVVRYNEEALEKAAEDVVRLAEAEGLPAHAGAVTVRTRRDG